MELLTIEVAEQLGVSRGRVLHLIRDGRLPARKRGRDWFIKARDLEKVRDRKPGYPKGRPRKKRKKA